MTGLWNVLWVPLLAQLLDRLFHPLDNLLSVQQRRQVGFGEGVRLLLQEHGWRGLYLGFLRPFLTFGLARVTMTSFYMNMKWVLLDLGAPFTGTVILCGLAAGAIDATLTVSGENVRTRAVFKLPAPQVWRDHFLGYEALLARSLMGATLILAGSDLLMRGEWVPDWLHLPGTAAFSMGVVSQLFTSPADIWKNKIIAEPQFSPGTHLATLVAEREFYTGIGTKMLRMGLGAAVVVSTLHGLRR